jgi:nicotinamidase-related amidase
MNNEEMEYLGFLDEFVENLADLSVEELASQPEKVALVSVDVTNAFCRTGNLASERVATIINPIVDLFNLAWHKGLRNFLLLHDCHTVDAEEFDAFGEHAICGTVESEAVDEFKALPFFGEMEIIEKNSINPAQNTAFDQWLENSSEIDTFVIVGDCTDLCVYQTAMHLRTAANASGIKRRVIVPENCVDTYDLSLDVAKNSPAEPHPANLLHKLFLHHMHLNGIEVFKQIK